MKKLVREQKFDLKIANDLVVHVAGDLDRRGTTGSEADYPIRTDGDFACSRRLSG